MQIVIDIPDEIYEEIQIKFLNTKVNKISVTDRAIYSGTPLPKGHGRLIDADKLKEEAVDMSHYVSDPCDGVWVEDIDDAPTIIDADKGSD